MMDTLPNDDIAVSVTDTALPVSAGKMLREARILQGLSVTDVAGRIKFAPRQVEALEADDFEKLPELTFVRGFVRSYARLLHLDETVLLNALPSTTKQPVPLKSTAEVPFPTPQSARSINVVWLSAALGLAVILGLGVLFFHDRPAKKPDESKPVVAVPLAVQDSAVSAVQIASSVAAASEVAEEVIVNEAPSVVIAPKVKVASKGSNKSPIHLVFNTESWVELKDKYGKTLLKQVNAPGTEQWIDGQAPFSLVIGNASGVRLYYEGDEVELKEFTEVEVARLILE
jgi:cytoskeleton protein RodZ